MAKYVPQVKAVLDQFSANDFAQVWIDSSDYNLAFTVKVCVNIPENGGCHNETGRVYIGNLEGQYLKDTEVSHHESRTDYAYDEIVKLRADYKVKERALSEASNALYPFGKG